MTEVFATRRDVADSIVQMLGDEAEEYNIDAISRAAFEYSTEKHGFVQTVNEEGFWLIAANCVRHEAGA